MPYKQLIQTCLGSPRKLFLVDGLGALVSAFLLGVVLVRLENIFGIPQSALYILAFVPCVFALYDFCCFFILKKNESAFLIVIGYANILYCLLSIGLAFCHHHSITYLGWTYLIVEIVIVLILAFTEIRTARTVASKRYSD